MTTTHTPSSAPTRHPLLPEPTGVTFTAPAEVDAHLSQIEAARQRQLDETASTNLDTVSVAYRATIVRILEEVRAARRRVAAGLYGNCTRCNDEIPAQRLELRPWVAMCVPCARRDHA